ncbi:MAG: methionine--tRNA ligase [bacterium]
MVKEMTPKFYITTAIDYSNNVPHLGTAYEKVCADVIARYMRLKGIETYFSMGNDEHSQNVYKGAISKGIAPEKFTDEMAEIFKNTWKELGISYDRFIRTTEGKHTRAVAELFRRIRASGDVYKAKYAGWYCVSCEGFLREDDLVDGKCPQHRMEPRWIEEDNLFFRLSRYAPAILEHIQSNPEFIQPEARLNEIVSFIKAGVSDVSISRTGIQWGISVPDEPSHVFYVWFDALINYLTAIGFPDEIDLFEHYWPADLHIIGKDITRFHCILWPAMLMSAGIELPRAIHGHGFVTFKGERMSKTLGNIIEPLDLARKYGADALRYYFCREIVFGKDGDFSWEQFIQRYNSELANDLGNLMSRTCGMLKQYFNGKIPVPSERIEVGNGLRQICEDVRQDYFRAMDVYEIHNGIAEVFKVIRAANRYIEECAPWGLVKIDNGKPKAAGVLFTLCEVLRQIGILIFPFMPFKAHEIWSGLGITENISKARFDTAIEWRDDWSGISRGIGEVKQLFPRIETESSKKISCQEKESKPLLGIDEFRRLDLRVARVKSASLIPGARKLLRLEIDIGGEERQIVAGIAEHYSCESLIGKSIVVVANLESAKIRGIESQGMLLAATDQERVILIVPDKDASPGSRIS